MEANSQFVNAKDALNLDILVFDYHLQDEVQDSELVQSSDCDM
jgi:hypothetical protein